MAAPLEFPVHIAARVREGVPSEIENHAHTMALYGRKIKGWLYVSECSAGIAGLAQAVSRRGSSLDFVRP